MLCWIADTYWLKAKLQKPFKVYKGLVLYHDFVIMIGTVSWIGTRFGLVTVILNLIPAVSWTLDGIWTWNTLSLSLSLSFSLSLSLSHTHIYLLQNTAI